MQTQNGTKNRIHPSSIPNTPSQLPARTPQPDPQQQMQQALAQSPQAVQIVNFAASILGAVMNSASLGSLAAPKELRPGIQAHEEVYGDVEVEVVED